MRNEDNCSLRITNIPGSLLYPLLLKLLLCRLANHLHWKYALEGKKKIGQPTVLSFSIISYLSFSWKWRVVVEHMCIRKGDKEPQSRRVPTESQSPASWTLRSSPTGTKDQAPFNFLCPRSYKEGRRNLECHPAPKGVGGRHGAMDPAGVQHRLRRDGCGASLQQLGLNLQ